MSLTLRGFRPLCLALAAALAVVAAACGSSTGPSLEGFPSYPNATPGESMAFSSPGGFVGGELTQVTTTDSYEDVIEFYQDALRTETVQAEEFTSELGRQTAVTITRDDGVITLAIQEFTEEGQVNVTLMGLGS